MAVTYTDNGTNTPNGSHKEFSYTFATIKTDGTDVKVALDGATQATNKYTVNTGSSPTKITFNNTNVDSTVQESDGSPKTGVKVRVYRDTLLEDADTVTFVAGSSIRAVDLNANFNQARYALQEEQTIPLNDEDISDGAITSAKIHDGTIVNADINASAAIVGSKLVAATTSAPGAMAAADKTKLDGIETSATADQTNAEIRTAVEAASDSNVFTDADHSKLNAIEANATADQTNAEIRAAVEAATDSNVFTDADHSKLNAIEASADVTDATNVDAAGAVMNSDASTAAMSFVVDEDNFSSDSATKVPTQQSTKAYIAATSQPLDGDLTTLASMHSSTASILAANTALTSDINELNLLDGKSIVTTISNSATDVQLPSAQAVNERIVELVTEVGGFVPIANETSFPATNPDTNDGAGTIVSVKALASNLTANGSGVATIANGAGSGNTVTINGMANSDTIEAGKGLLLETTTTLHTYTFHRETLAPSDVADAKTLVTDFNQRYQVAGSEPSNQPDGTSLADGDLWFDTSANTMKVYDLGNTQYNVVTSVGDFKLLTILDTDGSAFDGANQSFNLKDGSNAATVTSAGQLIVSVNGVIQKPNTGTGAPTEGFALVDSDTIIFSNAPGAGASVFVTLIGAATSVNVPATNSIVEAAIQTNVVSEEKLKISNAGTNGQYLQKQSGNSGGLTWADAGDSDKIEEGNTSVEVVDTGSDGKAVFTLDGSEKVRVTAGSINFADGYPFRIGSIAGTNTVGIHIDSNSGTNRIGTLDSNALQIIAGNQSGSDEVMAKFIPAGATELYFDNAKKAETVTGGFTITGVCTATSFAGDGSALTGLDSTKAGGAIYENSQTISTTHTLTANTNGMSAGPVTVNSGITLTIPSGATYTIV